MTQLEEIDKAIEDSKETIETAEALLRLKKNKDFKKVILDNYFVDHVSNLVQIKANVGAQDKQSQKYIENQLNAVGHLGQFLEMILATGVNAQESLESHEAERDYYLQEGEI